MKQIEKLQKAFSDAPPRCALKVENARYYPESFGNEAAMLSFGKLKMHFLSDRGATYADVLIPEQPNKFINMAALMQHFGFTPQSSDPIINLREFFRNFESLLLELGDKLARNEIPSDLEDLIITHSPGKIYEMKRR